MFTWLQKLAAKLKIKDLSDDELKELRSQGYKAISYLERLSKKFPKATFQTTFRQFDLRYNLGPRIAFMMFKEDIDADQDFYSFADTIGSFNIHIEGYMKPSGYDENSYRWLNGEWVGFNGKSWPWNTFESSVNLINLIKWNLVYVGIDTELSWRKYTKQPTVRKILESIDQYDVSIKDGEQMLLEAIPSDHDISSFINGYRNWWWGRKSSEEFTESLESITNEFQNKNKRNMDKYVYNISMDPHTDGIGKFIDFSLIEQAFEIYGNFNVLVQYHMSRIRYSASEILHYRKTNDDQSFNFFNQNGGIRQMWITK